MSSFTILLSENVKKNLLGQNVPFRDFELVLPFIPHVKRLNKKNKTTLPETSRKLRSTLAHPNTKTKRTKSHTPWMWPPSPGCQCPPGLVHI